MNRLRILLALFLCIVMVTGCTPRGYKIIKEDGTSYIVIDSERIEDGNSSANITEMEESTTIKFESIQEMRDDIKHGNFTDEEFKKLTYSGMRNFGKIEIPDLDNLYLPICPDNVVFNGQIYWDNGPEYGYIVSSAETDSMHIHMGIIKSESYEEARNMMATFEEDDRYEIILKIKELDRDGIAYTYTINGHRRMVSFSTISTGDADLLIKEVYIDSYSKLSSYVKIYGKQGDAYFIVYMEDYTERPTVEWLSSFGLEKFNG